MSYLFVCVGINFKHHSAFYACQSNVSPCTSLCQHLWLCLCFFYITSTESFLKQNRFSHLADSNRMFCWRFEEDICVSQDLILIFRISVFPATTRSIRCQKKMRLMNQSVRPISSWQRPWWCFSAIALRARGPGFESYYLNLYLLVNLPF